MLVGWVSLAILPTFLDRVSSHYLTHSGYMSTRELVKNSKHSMVDSDEEVA